MHIRGYNEECATCICEYLGGDPAAVHREGLYPEGHKFMMDNDPKHTLGYAAEWTRGNSVNW